MPEEYGNDNPRTSKAELIVFALTPNEINQLKSRKRCSRIHASASPRTGTRVPYIVKALLVVDFAYRKCTCIVLL